MTSKRIALLASLPLFCTPLRVMGTPAKPAAKPKATSAREEGALARAMVAALDRDDLVAVMSLVKRGADVNSRGQFGRTPLLLALYRNDTAAMKALLDKGARANDADIARFGGETPLMLAARKGNTEAAKMLIEYDADPKARSRGYSTSLTQAVVGGSNEIVKLLLENGVNADDRDNLPIDFGRYEAPLMIAAQNANVEGVKLLIEHGANVNAHESHGFSVLMLASSAVSSMSAASLGITERDKEQLQANQDAIVALLKAAGARDSPLGSSPTQYKPVGENLGF